MLRARTPARDLHSPPDRQCRPARASVRFGAFETRALLAAAAWVWCSGGALRRRAGTDRGRQGDRARWLARRAIERFRAERQLLAGLTHPGIARLIDGGTRQDGVRTRDGVCRWPSDRSLLRGAEARNPRAPQASPLCDAVITPTASWIVHRDLKPSNVLVTASGAAKPLDFGGQDARNRGRHTQTMIFTRFCQSRAGAREDAGTATDIYGLGGVLYHLLTGHTPRHRRPVADRAQRMICEQEPQRPSAWNSSSRVTSKISS